MPRICTRISVPISMDTGSTRLRCSTWVAPITGETTPPSCCSDWPRPTSSSEPGGDQVQIGRQEGRRVEDAKAGHAQHAVQEVAGEVARQVVPDEPLVGGLGLFEGLLHRQFARRQRSACPCSVSASQDFHPFGSPSHKFPAARRLALCAPLGRRYVERPHNAAWDNDAGQRQPHRLADAPQGDPRTGRRRTDRAAGSGAGQGLHHLGGQDSRSELQGRLGRAAGDQQPL